MKQTIKDKINSATSMQKFYEKDAKNNQAKY